IFRKVLLVFIIHSQLVAFRTKATGPEKERSQNQTGSHSEAVGFRIKNDRYQRLKDKDRVELQASEPRFRRSERTANECGKAQLYARIELVERGEPVLRHVCSLANVAVVEVAQYRFALDEDAGVSELQITLFLQASYISFSPISTTIMRV